MTKLRTAIIGCGKVADFHAKAFVNLPNSDFVAVCNHRLKGAEDFASKYNVNAYDNVHDMVEQEKIDIVSICTPIRCTLKQQLRQLKAEPMY